jgi:serine/threonine-protein kinase RsbW
VSRGELLLKLELRSNPEMLCGVRSALGELLVSLGFPDSECRAVILAVDEALANVIRHAYKEKPDQPIELFIRRAQLRTEGGTREGIEIEILDGGEAVHPSKLRGRPLDEVRPGGLGLHFIRQSMDSVEFGRSQGKNQLRLTKFLGTPQLTKDS